MDLENSVLVDNTASAVAAEVYEQALAHSIAVVASNKSRRQRCTRTL